MNRPTSQPQHPILTDPRDYILDLSSSRPFEPLPASESSTDSTILGPASSPRRPSLSVHFKCCNVYHRIYRTADGSAYAGNCPRCAKPIRIAIGSTGTSSRFFTAG